MNMSEEDKAETENKLQMIANIVESYLPDGFGFAILVFPFHEPGMCNYISNAQREDMVKALMEAHIRLGGSNG